jgi:hypothetical protein
MKDIDDQQQRGEAVVAMVSHEPTVGHQSDEAVLLIRRSLSREG